MVRNVSGTAPQLSIDYDRCQVCDDCLAKRKCRAGGFRIIDKGEAPVLDTTYCRSCYLCVHACPHGAVVRHDSPRTGSDR